MNMWVPRGKAAVTPERLLGEAFLREEAGQPQMSREEWDAHKGDLTKMARWHSKALRDMKAGIKSTRTAITFAELQADADGRRKPPGRTKK